MRQMDRAGRRQIPDSRAEAKRSSTPPVSDLLARGLTARTAAAPWGAGCRWPPAQMPPVQSDREQRDVAQLSSGRENEAQRHGAQQVSAAAAAAAAAAAQAAPWQRLRASAPAPATLATPRGRVTLGA